ncbi:NAD-dependent dehydratase [Dyadobacter sediminis]|uniref:NAD-dependent epimerase/dehydratase family protein n=2 Tax=Dyadobacter sediminis TaxID=1493691 RepID=A0A5R9KIS4_9BACT|nr:NAD-dependent epimerase/dehydratase family protein [Dyadobacter sediminis]GGB79441.1 NAD-dependent dehydratase [Dyadobacter sediminis]
MVQDISLNRKDMEHANSVGIVQWFHINQHREVERVVEDFQKLGVTHIRTNVSWADWHLPEGKAWYDWLFATLGDQLQVLPCILYTPPSIAVKPKSSAPPQNPKDFADFVDTIITEYGQYFDYIELWNEPNNMAEYDFTLDPQWDTFCEMVGSAANWCRQKGKKTVLGGMSPIDANWLREMFRKGLMEHIDVVGVHGFPDVFDSNWEGWSAEISKVQKVLDEHQSLAKIWITEAGFSTWQKNERKQVKEFIQALEADAERMYWYSLEDLSAELPAVDRFHLDEREYAFGMKNQNGSPKLLYTLLSTKGLSGISNYEWMTVPLDENSFTEQYTLITGGAGFVGINLADKILSQGKPVLILDNLSRAGVENNLFWLREKYADNLYIMIADIRDKRAVRQAVQHASHIYHFAAQVAVTSSLTDPYHDFEVNALGTLNLLEAIRNTSHQPSIIFTSTNKVYGDLHDLGMLSNETRYYPSNLMVMANGISEERNLDFHSPYGCTKGVADQYILDYARTFGIKSVVFRMSCIYGPHQFGTEDQGWVAHFLIQALKDKPITLYGDGKQVRDILFVDDLVNAFLLAEENIETISGNAYNIGGGPENTVSLLELIEMISMVSGERPEVRLEEWRSSDQKYYVSDFNKFQAVTGWNPNVSPLEGVEKLIEWLQENAISPELKSTEHSEIASKQPVF